MKKEEKSSDKNSGEVSEIILNEYNGFIKKKLGLDKKVSRNELYIFKYHTQLQ